MGHTTSVLNPKCLMKNIKNIITTIKILILIISCSTAASSQCQRSYNLPDTWSCNLVGNMTIFQSGNAGIDWSTWYSWPDPHGHDSTEPCNHYYAPGYMCTPEDGPHAISDHQNQNIDEAVLGGVHNGISSSCSANASVGIEDDWCSGTEGINDSSTASCGTGYCIASFSGYVVINGGGTSFVRSFGPYDRTGYCRFC